ncbi:hypothetical protein [Caulobacter sp. BK020]|nr:hypothetical protein [Caulobacter sp. BK020]
MRLAPQDEEFSNIAPHPEVPAQRASKDAGPTPPRRPSSVRSS